MLSPVAPFRGRPIDELLHTVFSMHSVVRSLTIVNPVGIARTIP
jgi:hypothetical protein